MPKPRENLRLLLIQVRDHAEAAAEEQQCFLERCQVSPEQLRVYNVIARPRIGWSEVGDADAVFIGGAGAHSVTETYEFTAPLADLLLRLLEEERPFFGSCWGHQFLGQVLGGTVETQPDNAEVGTFDAYRTADGRRDPLSAELPDEFAVQLGHRDHLVAAPPGLITLARSARSSHQLVRVAGKPAYGSQFHSEMSLAAMRRRVRIYSHYLEGGEDAVKEFDRNLRSSPEADGLLDRFLSLFV